MEDCDLGHPLTFGAFCGAFSVVSAEKWVMLVVPLLNSSIRYFSFTMNSSVIVGE
jgi:hypothetical protein